jgi:hypothetical protein
MRTIAPATRESGYVTLTAETVPSTDPDAAKDYLDRVKAYVPVEVVAFFIFVNSLVLGRAMTAAVGGGKDVHQAWTVDGWVALSALVVGALASVLFTFAAAKKAGQRASRVQALVTLVAFLVWAYALGARAFEVVGILIVPSVAGLLLGTFTLLSGFIVPVK